MKRILSLLIFSIIFIQVQMPASAVRNYMSPPMKVAIKKYKAGNFTGCLQDAQNIIKYDPSNAVAYYYMAMSYAQAGRKDKAIACYDKVLALKSNTLITGYAQTGKRCLETPDKCKEDGSTELDKTVAAPFGDGLSSKVREDINAKKLQAIKNQINSDADIDSYKFREFKDYTRQKSDAGLKTNLVGAASSISAEPSIIAEDSSSKQSADPVKISQAAKETPKSVSAPAAQQSDNKQPTNDEIVAALRVLQKAGLNPYAQQMGQMPMAQNPEMAQLNMLMQGNQSNSNSNNMMNMLPYMMAQGKNGENNPYSAQIMQSMIMGSMLPDFNLKTHDDD